MAHMQSETGPKHKSPVSFKHDMLQASELQSAARTPYIVGRQSRCLQVSMSNKRT